MQVTRRTAGIFNPLFLQQSIRKTKSRLSELVILLTNDTLIVYSIIYILYYGKIMVRVFMAMGIICMQAVMNMGSRTVSMGELTRVKCGTAIELWTQKSPTLA
jgi:hypothetical protein